MNNLQKSPNHPDLFIPFYENDNHWQKHGSLADFTSTGIKDLDRDYTWDDAYTIKGSDIGRSSVAVVLENRQRHTIHMFLPSFLKAVKEGKCNGGILRGTFGFVKKGSTIRAELK